MADVKVFRAGKSMSRWVMVVGAGSLPGYTLRVIGVISGGSLVVLLGVLASRLGYGTWQTRPGMRSVCLTSGLARIRFRRDNVSPFCVSRGCNGIRCFSNSNAIVTPSTHDLVTSRSITPRFYDPEISPILGAETRFREMSGLAIIEGHVSMEPWVPRNCTTINRR